MKANSPVNPLLKFIKTITAIFNSTCFVQISMVVVLIVPFFEDKMIILLRYRFILIESQDTAVNCIKMVTNFYLRERSLYYYQGRPSSRKIQTYNINVMCTVRFRKKSMWYKQISIRNY